MLHQRRRVYCTLQLCGVLAVPGHVGREDVCEYYTPKNKILLLGKFREKLNFLVEDELKGTAAVMILQHGAVIVERGEVRA
jgi:hypothetical protein